MSKITLRWSEQRVGDGLLLDTFQGDKMKEARRRVVESLGIAILGEDTPAEAWLRAMCEDNGLEYRLPVSVALRDAIFDTPGALRFHFWLC